MRGQRRPAKSSALAESTRHGQIEVEIAVQIESQGRRDRRRRATCWRASPTRSNGWRRSAPPLPDFAAADAFVWHPDGRRLAPVARVNRVEMSLLKGIDRVRDVLVENTERFAKGLPANNALLWGARGMGKSSLVKASHAGVNAALARKARARRSS